MSRPDAETRANAVRAHTIILWFAYTVMGVLAFMLVAFTVVGIVTSNTAAALTGLFMCGSLAMFWRDVGKRLIRNLHRRRETAKRHSSHPNPVKLLILALLGCVGLVARAEPPTRAETLVIAERYATHQWEASERNVLRGPDRAKVVVSTPNRDNGTQPTPDDGLWSLGTVNVGVPYKWGGFDSLESFDTGIRNGKAAGDLYTPEKRRKGGAAVSPYAVGIDCSGFISRCWKLPRKHSTETLASICRPLASPADLLPGDIMNSAGGHVLLFAKWLDEEKKRALFYEAEPFSKVIASEHEVAAMLSDGYRPLRYRQIRD